MGTKFLLKKMTKSTILLYHCFEPVV